MCPLSLATLHFLHRSFSEYFWSTCSGWEKVFGSEGVGSWHWIILNIVSKYLRKEGLLLSGLVSLFIPRLGTKSVSESKCSFLSLPIFFVAICLSVILGIQCYLFWAYNVTYVVQECTFLFIFIKEADNWISAQIFGMWLFFCIILWQYCQLFVCFHVIIGIFMRILGNIY